MIFDNVRNVWTVNCRQCGGIKSYTKKSNVGLGKTRLCNSCAAILRCQTYNHPMKGYRHTEEVKSRISKLNSGKKRSEEVKLQMSLSRRGKKHKSFTEEGKKNIRIGILNRLNILGLTTCKEDYGSKEFFEMVNEEGYNFKPKRFIDIGYDADGYDPDLHIWIEFDTLYHSYHCQKQKDILRQNNIIKYFETIGNPLKRFIRVDFSDQDQPSMKVVYKG